MVIDYFLLMYIMGNNNTGNDFFGKLLFNTCKLSPLFQIVTLTEYFANYSAVYI